MLIRLLFCAFLLAPAFEPGRAAPVPLPKINLNNLINITNAPYNAVGDGQTTNTTAIQNAINAAAAGGTTNGLGGGTVEIPPGVFLSGPLTMKSSVNLQIDGGAKLQMLPYGSYPGGSSPTDFIGASKLHDLEISGAGIIDGQGAAWWAAYNANSSLSRPKAMFAPAGCNPILIRDVTWQNPPNTHISFRSSNGAPCGNVTVSNITINTPDGTPNTDGMDMSASNVLVVNCYISDGDDHIAMGDSGAFDHDIVITNCFFGTGHGCSIGSFTQGGLSNLLVINCTWSGSGNGIRVKSERGRGGLVQGLTYQNLSMTNVQSPVLLYSYYNYGVGTLNLATPYMAATDAVQAVTSSTPVWRNILFSNVTATIAGAQSPVMIWGLPEMLISNVTLADVNIAGTKNCEMYNVAGLQFIDCNISRSTHNDTFTLYHTQLTLTNRAPAANVVTVNGLTTNGLGNALSFYNAPASLQNTNVLAGGSLTLGGGTFTVSNNLALPSVATLNFQLGTNAATLVVKGNLSSGGTNNFIAGAGFTNGTYTVMTYIGTLGGAPPVVGVMPAGYHGAFDTALPGQVNLVVTPDAPGAPASLTALGTNLLVALSWSAAVNAAGYRLQRSLTNGGPYALIATVAATNYADAAVLPGTTYYYVVSATNAAGESAGSVQAVAIPLPSLAATNLVFQAGENQLSLAWPADHLGWRLQIQTNRLDHGLGTNWIDWPGSTNVCQTNIIINAANGAVFLRLVYP